MTGPRDSRTVKKTLLCFFLVIILSSVGFHTSIQPAQADWILAPFYTTGSDTTFYLYDDTSPKTYMMFQSEPGGTSQNVTNGTYSFYSDTWTSNWQVDSGTTTVNLWVKTTLGAQTYTLRLKAGSDANGWTTLGTKSWSVTTGAVPERKSTTFSTNGYTFGSDERLLLEIAVPVLGAIGWDGTFSTSNIIVPGITTSGGTATPTNTSSPTPTPSPTPDNSPTPSSTPNGGSETYWFYDDTTPQQYMMYTSQPSGSKVSSNSQVDFFSSGFNSGQQLNAGTATVYFYGLGGFGNCDISLTLKAGNTTVGSGTITIPQYGGNASTSFSVSSYAFAADEKLTLSTGNLCFGASIAWDGTRNDSRVVVPAISSSISTDTPTPTATSTDTPTPTITNTPTPTATHTATPTPYAEVSVQDISFPNTMLDGTDLILYDNNDSDWQVSSTYLSGTSWSVNINASDLSTGAHNIPVGSFEVRLLDSNITILEGSDKPASQITSYTPLSLTDQLLLGYSGADGQGVFNYTPDFMLNIVAETYAGTYTSTVEVTFVVGP